MSIDAFVRERLAAAVAGRALVDHDLTDPDEVSDVDLLALLDDAAAIAYERSAAATDGEAHGWCTIARAIEGVRSGAEQVHEPAAAQRQRVEQRHDREDEREAQKRLAKRLAREHEAVLLHGDVEQPRREKRQSLRQHDPEHKPRR